MAVANGDLLEVNGCQPWSQSHEISND